MKVDFDTEKVILWGMDENTPEYEVADRVLRFIDERQDMPVATVNNGQPECRICAFDRLSDGALYFMTSKGKPLYGQLKKTPQLVICTMAEDCFSLRLHGFVKEIGKGAEWDEFFGLNPGTLKMYRNNLDIMALFRIEKGEGEVFHLYGADKVKRLRFSFGGLKKVPMTYYINEEMCIGCGECFRNCAEEAIRPTAEGKYRISCADCDGCGICYTHCPLAGSALINRIETEKGYFEE